MISRRLLACAALFWAGAAGAQTYGPPPPPSLPDGYMREARTTAILWRPAGKSRGVLVVADEEPNIGRLDPADLLQIARARRLTVVFLGSARADPAQLRAALLPLRGDQKVIGYGARAEGDALQSLARTKGEKLFDALLLKDSAPLEPSPGAPFTIELYGGDAFWRGPAPPPAAKGANIRRYFLAGAVTAPADVKGCAAPSNGRSVAPAERALLVALDDFLHGGPAPPASREAELVSKKSLAWPKIPGAGAPPSGDGLAPKIDVDGNETSGLRLPDQALPIATFTAWGPPHGACHGGARFDFPATREARERAGDPRLPLVERYGSRAYFVAALRSVADRLVKERLLTPQDADAYVAAGKQAPF